MREGNNYADRDFMKELAIGHPKLKACEADPSLFTVRELMLLSVLIGRPINKLLEAVLAEASKIEYVAAPGRRPTRKAEPAE
jgi:hypothetical protein